MKFMETSVSPSSSLLHPVSPYDIKKEKVEVPSPPDCGSGLGSSGMCAACGEMITERFLVQVSGRTWHSGCLRCCVCRAPLDTQPSCFVRGGSVYCRADYTRTFGAKCARCGRAISATDWVRRAREHVYHLACFACDACRRQLSTGEEFALHEGRVLCKTHYLDGLDAGSTSSDETDPEGSGRSKSKRVRTTFTEEQLHILQANFLLDSNPDGQDLERIANLTGLSKRVTQVWFQNMRARHKKHLTSANSSSSSSSSGQSKNRRNNNNASASSLNSNPDSLDQKRVDGNVSAEQPGYSLHLLYSYTMQTPDGGESSSNDSVMRSVRGDM